MAFHTFTNQMLVAASTNQRLYSSSEAATSTSTPRARPSGVGVVPARTSPTIISTRPTATPGSPQGEKLRSDSQNWLSTGLSSTKSRVPFCTWVTRAPRFGCSSVLVSPSSRV